MSSDHRGPDYPPGESDGRAGSYGAQQGAQPSGPPRFEDPQYPPSPFDLPPADAPRFDLPQFDLPHFAPPRQSGPEWPAAAPPASTWAGAPPPHQYAAAGQRGPSSVEGQWPSPSGVGLARTQERRPTVVTLSGLLTVTASLQAVCAVAMIWLIIYAGVDTFDPTNPSEGPLFHILERANLSLANGLAAPLLGLPAVATVAGLLVLIRANWTRILSTALGLGTSVWLTVWQLHRIQLVAVPICYIAVCVLLLWLPAANAWYRRRS